MSEDREKKTGRLADDSETSTDDVEAHVRASRQNETAPPSEDEGDDVEAHVKATRQ
jgi:hypothetical protein